MLKSIRVTLSIIFFACITWLFLDFTGLAAHWFGWMPRIQFLPALLSGSILTVCGLIIATLVLGRVYCSVICPLGVMQDVINWVSNRFGRRRFRFRFSKAKTVLRLSVLLLFVIAFIIGIAPLVDLLAPYSAYGRIAQNILAPVYGAANNILAFFAEKADSYMFYHKDIYIRSLSTFGIATVTLVILAILAWRNGRTYCNTICPVGTILGYLSKFALLRPMINTDKCVNCSLCGRQCKASCIDTKNHKIDYSRCVTCFDCLNNCTHGAIYYGFCNPFKKSAKQSGTNEKPAGTAKTDKAADAPKARTEATQQTADKGAVDAGRRNFIVGAAIATGAAAAYAQAKKVDGGLAVIEDKKVPRRVTPIVPPGAKSLTNLAEHCTGCQLCVANCPNGVLRPSSDLKRLMQPESSYEIGYCRPECTACSDVCPTGAIISLDEADKSSIQIGHAVWIAKNCIVNTDDVECGNCARHCPVGAIHMVASDPDDEESRKIPVVNDERCIGCGACENLCPARPFSAIYVEGHEKHRYI